MKMQNTLLNKNGMFLPGCAFSVDKQRYFSNSTIRCKQSSIDYKKGPLGYRMNFYPSVSLCRHTSFCIMTY